LISWSCRGELADAERCDALAGADARAAALISEAAWLRPSAVAVGTTRHAVCVISPYPRPIPVAAHEREPFFVNNAEL
jgi:hypothetical protein